MKSRTLKIINYLNKERMASYKEIGEAVGESERAVRYDVDSINDELSFQKLPCIEKYSKGMLFVPDKLDLSVLCSDQEYIYSNRDRLSIIRMNVLFDIKHFNLRKLSEKMQISRRSIQNDVEEVQKQLKEDGIELVYDKKYQIQGDGLKLYNLRGKEIKKYVDILTDNQSKNTFEKDICQMIEDMVKPTPISEILQWVDRTTEEMEWTLSDDSYKWYVARVVVFSWYLEQNIEIPSELTKNNVKEDNILGKRVDMLGSILGVEIDENKGLILASFSKFINKYVDLDVRQDFISIEDISMYMVNEMKKELQVDFISDRILLKGLLNHIGPMLERMKAGVQLNEKEDSFIPDEYSYVYEKLDRIIKKHVILKNLTDNEIIYLAVYFLGSIRRLQQNQYMTVLLICGFGYGTTAVVKDALLNSYQVFVRNSIPVNKVSHYKHWDEIDLVISTVKVDLPVNKKVVNVNVVFTNEDYIKLDLAGLRKKNTLTNLFSIEKKLNFLDSENKEKVMDIIKEELGYKEVRMPKKYYKLSDLLMQEDIMCVEKIDDWRDAVKSCTGILKEHNKITVDYQESIIKGMERQGFYSIIDQEFALLHGSETAGVNMSCMSLVISREPISFGYKKVNLVFCLASKDKKEHIPAIIRMMRMIEMTKFVDELSGCENKEQAIQVIAKCEKEVESCYPS